MIRPDRDILNKLLALSQEKLALLENLSQSLWELCNGISENETDALAAHSQKQYGITNRIDYIDKEFAILVDSFENNISPLLSISPAGKGEIPEELEEINQVLGAQRLALIRISALNSEAIAKAQALANSFKEKIVGINRKKNALASYPSPSEGQVGILLDYKEKQRR